MKRFSAILMSILLILMLFSGCGNDSGQTDATVPETTSAPEDISLSVGFGRADITPETNVPIAGGAQTISTGVDQRLYADVIAISDNLGNSVMLISFDLLFCYGDVVMSNRKIAKETGIDALHILYSAHHNHNGPELGYTGKDPSIDLYVETLSDKVAQAGIDAWNDRKPVTGLYTAKAYPWGMNFLRHALNNDGKLLGKNEYRAWAANRDKTMVGQLFSPDNEMQLVKFTREGGKDIVLMNWQAHPKQQSDTKDRIISQVDCIRSTIEPALDCHFAYYLGASGNTVSGNAYNGGNLTSNHQEHGQRLGQIAIEAAKSFKEVRLGKVKFIRESFEAQNKSGNSTLKMPLYAVSFGDVAFATAPYEMFTENGQAVKRNSPYETTIMMTCSMGEFDYVCSDYCYDLDKFKENYCYEMTSCEVARGTAEALVEAHGNLLKTIYETN